MVIACITIALLLCLGAAAEPDNANAILRDCCGFSSESASSLLMRCLHKHESLLRQSSPVDGLQIGMTTYYDENIEDYASYSLAINAGYVSERGYGFVIHSPQTQSNFEPRDARWNRVKILSNMMDLDYDYLMWVDADLAITDWSLSLEKLIGLHPRTS